MPLLRWPQNSAAENIRKAEEYVQECQRELARERQEAEDAKKVAEKERAEAYKAQTIAQAEQLEAEDAAYQLEQKAAKAAALDPDGAIARAQAAKKQKAMAAKAKAAAGERQVCACVCVCVRAYAPRCEQSVCDSCVYLPPSPQPWLVC